MANLACGSSELGLVHALSLSSAVHLPHGYQNAVLMPYVGEFHRPAVSPAVAREIDRVVPLYQQIGFDPHFRPGELDATQAESMVQVALAVPLSANNARQATAEQLRDILAAAGAPAPVSSVEA